jgi:hypothetical protein
MCQQVFLLLPWSRIFGLGSLPKEYCGFTTLLHILSLLGVIELCNKLARTSSTQPGPTPSPVCPSGWCPLGQVSPTSYILAATAFLIRSSLELAFPSLPPLLKTFPMAKFERDAYLRHLSLSCHLFLLSVHIDSPSQPAGPLLYLSLFVLLTS